MAGDRAARPRLLEEGRRLGAERPRMRAAGVEAAAAWRRGRARHVALQQRPRSARGGTRHGNRRQQRLGVGMERRRRRALRPAPARRSSPRYITATRSLMCRITARSWAMMMRVRPKRAFRSSEQIDDLRLDRDVERRDRLVADDQLRLAGQRAGDADALALAAGELVRIARRHARAAGRPCAAEPPPGLAARRRRPGRAARSARRRCRRPSSAG